ncbi:MAG TPA: transglutaminase-like domain-containing protein [Pseudomonadota bacterium]|nr:transglutaminase-like domain-containing protein [Pseudomonadota bacterium]
MDPLDSSLHVALFAHHVARPDDEINLGQAALLIAMPEYPDLDIDTTLSELDRLADMARPALSGLVEGTARAVALVQFLLDDQGFRGNTDEYDDPRNSFLNEVLSRRLGIPITLAVVAIEVARRMDVPLRGVSFPGHFLLRADGKQSVLIDPFNGRAMTVGGLADLIARVYGQRRSPRPDEVVPAPKHAILSRMLTNLRNLYLQRGDIARQRLAEERIRAIEVALRNQPGHAIYPAPRSGLVH